MTRAFDASGGIQNVALVDENGEYLGNPSADQLPAALGPGGGLKLEPAPGDYETVAASQTDQMLGATGAVGDRLDALLVIPATLDPGAISIEQGSTNTVVFTGGTGSVTSLQPFLIVFGTCGIVAAGAGWEISTGVNVSCLAFGQFT
jgi:hypothetical protein